MYFHYLYKIQAGEKEKKKEGKEVIKKSQILKTSKRKEKMVSTQ